MYTSKPGVEGKSIASMFSSNSYSGPDATLLAIAGSYIGWVAARDDEVFPIDVDW